MTDSLPHRALAAATDPASFAELRQVLSRRELAHWRRSARGFYVPSADPHDTAQRIRDAAVLLPAGGAIGGWAAAYVHGASWLDGQDPHTGRLLPVRCCTGTAVHRPSLSWLTYTRAELPPNDVVTRCGLPVTTTSRTASDGARFAKSLEEAVVFLDALAAFGLLDLGRLTAHLNRLRGRVGIRQAYDAALLTRPGVRSPWESRLRFRYVVVAGLSSPLVNPPVFSAAGRLLGYPDLLDVEAGLVSEFDGAGHRDRAQHRRDNLREEQFEAHNLTVTRLDSLDVGGDPAMLRERLRDAYRRGLRRDRRRDRWTLTPPQWWPTDLGAELTDEQKEDIYGSS